MDELLELQENAKNKALKIIQTQATPAEISHFICEYEKYMSRITNQGAFTSPEDLIANYMLIAFNLSLLTTNRY
jgi:hypothetical protein